MKKALVIFLALCMILSMAACNLKITKNVTESHTDANGNTTTTTQSYTNENGKVTESNETVTINAAGIATAGQPEAESITCEQAAQDGQMHTFPWGIRNRTGITILSCYTVAPEGNIKEASDCLGGNKLAPDQEVSGDFSYNKDQLVFDFVCVFEGHEDDSVRFSNLSFKNVKADTETLWFVVTQLEDGSFNLNFQ